MKPRIKQLLALSIIFIGTAIISAAVLYKVYFEARTVNFEPARKVTIDEGATLKEITALLEREKIIGSGHMFELWVRFLNLENKIRHGEYLVEGRYSLRDLLDIFLSGRTLLYRLTVPEGFTIQQIAARMESLGLCSAEQISNASRDPVLLEKLGIEAPSLEGYCFPDTYLFPRDWTAQKILTSMVERFREVFDDDLKEQAAALEMNTLEVVTLASIIEKESSQMEELPKISAVFHNRLKKKIPLMADPAVIYGLENFDGNLRKDDLGKPGPYNLYRKRGLPPGPISNPGLPALRATLFPSDTDYLYFVSKNDGTHYFSSNLREHNRAVSKYQKDKN